MKKHDDFTQGIIRYYSGFDEKTRLSNNLGLLEFTRTLHLIRRSLKEPPAVVLDIGGAVGRYACPLAEKGYEVHLVDPVPAHVRQAQKASESQPHAPITSCSVGDARRLEFEAESADALLLLGPLYHLCAPHDRHQALKEAYRVLKPGGTLFAVGISRYASLIDGLASGSFLDPDFQVIMKNDLNNGQHRNPTNNPWYFTDAFFHHPDELKNEVSEAGFSIQGMFAIEGMGYLTQNFTANWENEENRAFLLETIEQTESEPSLLGASPHIMCTGEKPRST